VIRERWEQLSPGVQRSLSVGAIGLGVLVVIAIFAPAGDDGRRSDRRQETIRHVLTDANTREIGVDSLAASVRVLSGRNEELRKEVDRLKRDMQNQRSRATTRQESEVQREITRLQAQVAQLSSTPSLQTQVFETPDSAPVSPVIDVDTSDGQGKDESAPDPGREIFATAPLPMPIVQDPPRRGASVPALSIRLITPEFDPIDEPVPEEPVPLYLPAGSLLSGTLITGLDAPTHESARREPFPALLRIQKEAILPNRFRTDVRECFLIAAGYGDLSSERAYLRGETLSCVRHDGGVIETRLDSYAVGEDGKAGIRGRLVSKQGQLVARSMTAGFLQGLAGAFDVNPVPTIRTGDTGDTQLYQRVMSSDAIQGAAIKGTGKALDRIAQFYLDMAENMFPVIEVDAARRVDVIVTRGTALSLAQGARAP
jgi:conjugal transfer pilus assembly protein TraB